MKELTRRILESGLVDKHTAMAMERWGSLDRGASDIVGTKQVTKETFQALADDIAVLVDTEQPLRETVLDFEIKGEEVIIMSYGLRPFVGFWDEMLRLVVGSKARLMLGDIVAVRPSSGNSETTSWKVINIEPIYVNEKMVAQRITTITP